MIAPPGWMYLTEPLPDSHRFPARVREVLAAVRGAGIDCAYAGTSEGCDVFLVSGDGTSGRLVVDPADGLVDLWPIRADPNGMPSATAHISARHPAPQAAVRVLGRG